MLKDYDAKTNPNLTIWATHYSYMNDPKEFEIGVETCIPLIKEIEDVKNIAANDRLYSYLNEDKDIARQIGLLGSQFKNHNSMISPYSISFSKLKDSLQMWNRYGQNGNGIALCFDMDKIRQNKNFYKFDSCVYINNKEVTDEIIKKVKNKLLILYNRLYKEIPSIISPFYTGDDYEALRVFFFSTLLFMGVASFIKDEAYADEKEYRILAFGENEILFRERNGEIIPYVEYKVPIEALANVIVGPTRDFERTRNSIMLLLNNKDISWSPDKIIQSNVPYRG